MENANETKTVVAFNREEYREIRKYSREQFENYLNQIYAAAERSGRQEAEAELYNEGALRQGEFMLTAIGSVLRDMSFDEDSVSKFMTMLSEKMTELRGSDEAE